VTERFNLAVRPRDDAPATTAGEGSWFDGVEVSEGDFAARLADLAVMGRRFEGAGVYPAEQPWEELEGSIELVSVEGIELTSDP
jgi:hypothetical protein